MNEKTAQEKLQILAKLVNDGSRLPYDSSNKMAKTLKVEDWGTVEEVTKMSEMLREAKTKKEAKAILFELRNKGYLENNKNPDLKPTLSRQAIKKLSNGDLTIAANIDQLFKNAIKPWEFELNPDKDNSDIEDRDYMYSPINKNGKLSPVKITVLKHNDKEKGTRVYSGELVDHDLEDKKQAAGQHRGGKNTQSLPARQPIYLGTAGNDAYTRDLVGKANDTQSLNNIPHQSHYVNRIELTPFWVKINERL